MKVSSKQEGKELTLSGRAMNIKSFCGQMCKQSRGNP